MSLDLLVHRVRPASAEPEGALVLLHGRGSHEGDLFPLLDIFDPDRRLVGITPRAPLQLPPGGNHWYVSAGIGTPEPSSFMSTYELLSEWLEAVESSFGVSMSKTILGGFSQGAVMTYAMGLGQRRPRPAGLLALSGFMPTVEGFSLSFDDLKGYPVAISHGSLDTVIGVEWGRQARDRLVQAGADVIYREFPMGHGVDPQFASEIPVWIRKIL